MFVTFLSKQLTAVIFCSSLKIKIVKSPPSRHYGSTLVNTG